MPITDYNPYSTIQPMLGGSLPGWIADKEEQLRVASYGLYEQIYWDVPESFKLVQRGEDDEPIYIPAGRIIVETLHRYLANDMQIIADPQFGTDQERDLADAFWTSLARRERFYSQFNTNKRMGIIRGDWVFHMRGDPERAEGARISIETVNPDSLFAIKNDEGDIIGWHLVEHIKDEDGKNRIRRSTYRKVTEKGGPSPITVEVGVYDPDSWGGPGQEKEVLVREIQAAEQFPDPIDQLPIYHIPNFQDDDHLWGSSEMRGLERVLAAVDQSISDEELELVLNGLGAYVTDMDKPLDSSGSEVEWDLGPGRVVQVARGGRFEKVTGVQSVAPHQDHLKYLHEQIDQASGTPQVAKGRVDVTVAESGVALTMQMSPLLARVAEKEQIVTDVISNYLFDLTKWVVAYEGNQWRFLMDNIRYIPVYGDKIPVNRKERFDEVMTMATAAPIPVMPMNVAWDELRKLGYDLPPDEEMWQMIAEQIVLTGNAEMEGLAGKLDAEQEEERLAAEMSDDTNQPPTDQVPPPEEGQ